MKQTRQQKHLLEISQKYPNAWKHMDMFRNSQGKDGIPTWPNWCFAPMAASAAIVTKGSMLSSLFAVQDYSILSALSAWRSTQGIYRFDPDTYQSIKNSKIDEIPVDIFYQLPEWCVYIETPDSQWMGKKMYGFYAHLEWDVNSNGARHELRLLIDTDDELLSVPLHLIKGTINNSLNSVKSEAIKQGDAHGLGMINKFIPTNFYDFMAMNVEPLLSLIMYICSSDADIINPRNPTMKPQNPSPKKTRRKGKKTFAAKKTTIWETGFNLGKVIRNYNKQSSKIKGTKRPHVRRAHWHHYWQIENSKTGRKKLRKL